MLLRLPVSLCVLVLLTSPLFCSVVSAAVVIDIESGVVGPDGRQDIEVYVSSDSVSGDLFFFTT